MIELTPEANTRFEEYLQRMRSALRGTTSTIETAEVEQSVREHVDIALAGAGGPVGVDRLGEVLEQLGPPDRWITDDERSWWRRLAQRISTGPEDWRLSYLAFATFVLGLVTLPIGIGVFIIFAGFFLSRATVELLEAREEPLGARRWLVLPAIWTILLPVCAGALIALIAPVASVGLDDGMVYRLTNIREPQSGTLEEMRIQAGVLGLAAGGWWLIVSAIFAAVLKPFRTLFLPVTRNLTRKSAAVLALVAVMVGSLGAVLLFVM